MCVVSAALFVVTTLGASASPASAGTSTLVVAQQTYRTSSPACTFTFRLSETLAGATVTGLQNHGTASCPGLAPPMDLGTSLWDASMTAVEVEGSSVGTGLGFTVAAGSNHITDGSAGVVDAGYAHPRATHEYVAGLFFSANLPAGVTADQSPYCTQTEQSWSCSFDLSTTPASGQNVGPAPGPAPITQALTVPADAAGGTCQLTADLHAADATTLSYSGHTACPPNIWLAGGAVFVYADRKEASQLGEGPDSQCYQCPEMTVSGQIPAVKGKTYTATFYAFLNVDAPMPPACTSLGGNLYMCEVSASAVF